MAINATAVEILKTFGLATPSAIPDLSGTLRRFFDDKGFDPSIGVSMAHDGSLARLFLTLVLGETPEDNTSEEAYALDYAGANLLQAQPSETARYFGRGDQNSRIDRALANRGHRAEEGLQGEGATSFFLPHGIPYAGNIGQSLSISDTPIAIIGNGAAGIILRSALRRVGFYNVTTYEASPNRKFGIWGQENVYRGTKNNPRDLVFTDYKLERAPGSGEDVRNFLGRISNGDSSSVINQRIAHVRPGTLDHEVFLGNSERTSYPIVINAIGLGKPKPLSDRKRMTTNATVHVAGPRWQQQLTREQVHRKRFVFIGLGNSTAEMIRQIHDYMDDGADVDYRIVTHYPEDAVWNPRAYVPQGDRTFRVFRDLSKPNLVDYQGDLEASLGDYFRALHSGRILFGVKRWETDSTETLFVAFNEKGRLPEFRYDQIFTLTGLEHSKETFDKFGCHYDRAGNCALYDYDGEFVANQKEKGGSRLFKGYFGFGSILEAPWNPNAIVIPGMLHRLGDLLFAIIMRAAEYESRRR